MSETGVAEPPNYPWYQSGSWTGLEQGDLLPECPVPVPSGSWTAKLLSAHENDEIEIPWEVKVIDLIVMSQTCDLVQNKLEQVLLGGYFPASEHPKPRREEIRKERFPALHMIEKCDLSGLKFERQIVDFRTIYTLPKDFVIAFAASLGERLRLLSPYKEHLSQAFARYFMRVGLPRPLKEETATVNTDGAPS